MVQMIEHLDSKHKALSSNPSAAKKILLTREKPGEVAHAHNPSTQQTEAC
jgi:hypothetical protein